MKNTLTRVDALNFAIDTISHIEAYGEEVARMDDMVSILTKIRDQIAKPRKTSDEAKARANSLRKEKTAAARAELVAKIAPVLREGLSHTLQGVTAKELFSLVQRNLPEDFTAPKVQNILLREMRDELNIIEAKGKANLYTLKAVTE